MGLKFSHISVNTKCLTSQHSHRSHHDCILTISSELSASWNSKDGSHNPSQCECRMVYICLCLVVNDDDCNVNGNEYVCLCCEYRQVQCVVCKGVKANTCVYRCATSGSTVSVSSSASSIITSYQHIPAYNSFYIYNDRSSSTSRINKDVRFSIFKHLIG